MLIGNDWRGDYPQRIAAMLFSVMATPVENALRVNPQDDNLTIYYFVKLTMYWLFNVLCFSTAYDYQHYMNNCGLHIQAQYIVILF